MDDEARHALAAAILEALETGNAVAPLVPDLCPADVPDGEAVAEAVLDGLGLAPCGLRLLRRPDGSWIAGPMLPTRLLQDGAPIAMSALRNPRVSAAAIGVLAAPLEAGANGRASLAAVHAALDVASTRLRDGAADAAQSAADLAELGFVVAGRRAAPPAAPVAASCAIGPKRPKGAATDLDTAFAAAAAAARRLGGLPVGALLVVAGLTPAMTPGPGETWMVRMAGLGRAGATFGTGRLPPEGPPSVAEE